MRPLFLSLVVVLLGCTAEPFGVVRPDRDYVAGHVDDVALAWARALVRGDTGALDRLTLVPFTFGTTSDDRTCERRVPTKDALAELIRCIRGRPELQLLAQARTAFGPLPVELGTADGLVRKPFTADEFVSLGIDRENAEAEARRAAVIETPGMRWEALATKMGHQGTWVRVEIQWLYHQLQLRFFLPGERPPGVSALLMHLHEFAD